MQLILRSIATYALARLSLSILTLFAALVVANAAELTNQFVQANLAYGATIQIPRAWKVARGNEMRAIETTVGAALDLSGMARAAEGTESLLFAKLDDPRLYASVGVTVVAIKNSTPRSLSDLTAMEIKAGESSVRQGIESMLARLGSTVSAWTPLEKVRLGDTSALHMSYLRSSDAGERRVHIYKVFGTGRVYDVIVSTSLVHEDMNSIVLNRVASSFKVQ